MKELIPEQIQILAQGCPFPLYVTGGAVRDCLAGLKSAADWDLAAPVSAETFEKAAQKCGFTVQSVYKHTGTVNVSKEGVKIEFTSFRTDKYRRGEHAPCDVVFTDDIETDAKRRDFKCNAVYYEIARGEFVDPLGGIRDIRDKIISTTREADEVFSEDGLRLMRLARQAAQLGSTEILPMSAALNFAPNRVGKSGVKPSCAA